MVGRVQSFMLILGLIGLDHFSCQSGWVKKIGPTSNSEVRNTLQIAAIHKYAIFSG